MPPSSKYVVFFCDDCDLLTPVITIFRKHNPVVEVHTFSDMSRLFEKVNERRPELILIYLIRPDEGYIPIIKRIRENVSSSSVPVYVYQKLPEESELIELFKNNS
jgi:DNA-binding response OmpR family regulator